MWMLSLKSIFERSSLTSFHDEEKFSTCVNGRASCESSKSIIERYSLRFQTKGSRLSAGMSRPSSRISRTL